MKSVNFSTKSNEIDYSNLSAHTFTIWGLLATVSMGTIAVAGAIKKFTIPFGITMCTIYLLFAASNYAALNKNFETRKIVVSTAKKVVSEEKYSNNSELISRLAMTYKDEDTGKLDNLLAFWDKKGAVRNNLLLHIFLDLFTAVIVLTIAITKSQKHK